jgi:hypothetical protein
MAERLRGDQKAADECKGKESEQVIHQELLYRARRFSSRK